MGATAIRDRIEAEDRRRPGVAELARHLSLTVRVEPALLRRIRLQFLVDVLPNAGDAGLESDLWFSGLVESRGPGGFVLDAEVADVLRQDLARDGDRLERVLEVMREVEPDAPESMRLEEEVTALALPRDSSDEISESALASIDEKLHGAVLAIADGEAPRAYDVARWALRALPRLPEAARSTEAGVLLALVSSAHLDGREVIPVADRPEGFPHGTAWAMTQFAAGKPVQIGIRIHERAVEWVDPGQSGALTFEAPRTDPVYVELRWREGPRDVRRGAAVRLGERVELPAQFEDLRVRTVAGREFVFEPADGRAPATAPSDDPLRSSCVLVGTEDVGFFVAADRVLTRLGDGITQPRSGRTVTIEFQGAELAATVVAERDRFCLLGLRERVQSARVLDLAETSIAPVVGTTWRAYGRTLDGALELRGAIQSVVSDGQLLLSKADAVPARGSPVLIEGRVVGQVDARGLGTDAIAVPVTEIVDFLAATTYDQRRPSVFISFATDSREYVQAVSRELAARDFVVLYDRGLGAGADWSPRIDEWVSTCDAAIIVLSTAALRSQWVAAEAAALRMRRGVDPSFRLLPALLGSVGYEALAPFGLSELQGIRAEAPDQFAAVVERALEGLTSSPPDRGLLALRRWLIEVFQALPSSELEYVAGSLDLPTETTVPLPRRAAEVASVAISQLSSGDPGKLINALFRGMPQEDVGEIVRRLLPLLVDRAAAAEVRRVTAGPPGTRAAALRTSALGIASLYVAGAWLEESAVPSTTIESGYSSDEMIDDLLERVTASLRHYLALDASELSEVELDRLLADEPIPVTAILDARGVSVRGVAELQARVPHLGLFLLIGRENLRDDLAPAQVTLLPDLDERREQQILAVQQQVEAVRRRSRTVSAPAPRRAVRPRKSLLLARYTPLLRYDSREQYYAGSPAMMTDSVTDTGEGNRLVRADGTVLASSAPVAGESKLSLSFLGPDVYESGAPVHADDMLVAAGDHLAADAAALQFDPAYAHRVYGRWIPRSDGDVWLQYWFFYYADDRQFLGFRGHQGDWELVQFRVDADGRLVSAGMQVNAGGTRYGRDAVQFAGGSPVVYVARGSHTNYNESGRHVHDRGADDADGRGREIQPTLEIIGPDTAWVNWPGRWGATKGTRSSSPPGPGRHVAWASPDDWYERLLGASSSL